MTRIMYSVYGDEQGEIKDGFKTMKEAIRFIKELKKDDMDEGIEDTYHIEKVTETDEKRYSEEVY